MHTFFSLLSDSRFSKKSILEKLLRHRCDLTKESLFAYPDSPINDDDYSRIIKQYDAYVHDAVPLEYILGYVEFLGVRFLVNNNTLIPRPETEYMINAVNERIHEHSSPPRCFFDIGTGCGVLGISTYLHNPGLFEHGYMSDISQEALDVTMQNIQTLLPDVSVSSDDPTSTLNVFVANILDHTLFHTARKKCAQSESPLLLVANLPYIPEGLFDENTDRSVQEHEPKFAFVGGEDGLDWYRVLFDQMITLQEKKPVVCTQFLEMMTRQIAVLEKEYGQHFTFIPVKTFHFNIRIVQVSRK